MTGLVSASSALDISDMVKANKTISVLNLNAEYLMKRRSSSLQMLNKEIEALVTQNPDPKSDILDFSEVSQQISLEIVQLVKNSLELQDRVLPEFYSAKKQLLESFGIQANPP